MKRNKENIVKKEPGMRVHVKLTVKCSHKKSESNRNKIDSYEYLIVKG